MSAADVELMVLRLALRGVAEAPVSRLRAERLLALAEPRPATLPAGAVLVVRALRVAAPLDSRGPTAGWSAGLRARLELLYREAARPSRGPVSPSAASVRFADAAEMLACLTRDVLAGQAWGRWYWRRALGDLPQAPGPALAAAWRTYVTALPPALAQLAPAEARAALLRMRPTEVGAVVRALHAAYALPPTIFTPPQPPTAAAPALRAGQPPERPWHAWLAPVAAAGLDPQAEYLLGTALALWHAPALARSLAFAERATAWVYRELGREAVGGALAGRDVSASQGPPDSIAAVQPATADERGPRPVADAPEPTAHGLRQAAGDPEPTAHGQAPKVKADGLEPTAHSPRPDPRELAANKPAAISGRRPPTVLGGALYLINLLDRLGWPMWHADDGAAALGGWGLIDALARALLGEAAARYADDPLWAALAVLDGRPPDLPIGAALAPEAAEWLEQTVAASRAALARLLADDSPEAVERLLCVRARLALSRTHVDLHMALDSINITARRTGLDRDPGWVPQLGRIVLFHFD